MMNTGGWLPPYTIFWLLGVSLAQAAENPFVFRNTSQETGLAALVELVVHEVEGAERVVHSGPFEWIQNHLRWT